MGRPDYASSLLGRSDSPFLSPPLALAAVECADLGVKELVARAASVGHLSIPYMEKSPGNFHNHFLTCTTFQLITIYVESLLKNVRNWFSYLRCGSSLFSLFAS